ncbi:MAG TPA: ribonuclease E/G, partial [Pyrinomonadaceae bacterium]|nr:ribonuclease E/G [Pyrinomonadaceae bacterium]
MAKEMIISVNGREKKIAILDNGRVTEFYIERGEENTGIAGNIYKGRVQRVLPGMQSAFVAIGLERDAFLYVSDFFDEEEEIERIVTEKSKKGSPEEAKREANDRIERARLEREKQMESAQEIMEPLSEGSDEGEDEEKPQARRGGRGRRGQAETPRTEDMKRGGRPEIIEDEDESRIAASDGPVFEFDDSGFERIVDDSETGELFKDAYMQEAIVDRVRAVEFDMESTDEAPVGSLLDSLSSGDGGFERIADEEEEPETTAKPAKGKKAPAKPRAAKSAKRSTKKADGGAEDESEDKPAKAAKSTTAKTKAKSTAAKAKATKSKAKTTKAKADADQLPDAEAGVKEPSGTAEMSVRRGGRGRRRGGRGRKPETGEAGDSNGNGENIIGFEDVAVEAKETEAAEPIKKEPAAKEAKESRAETNGDGDKDRSSSARGRTRGGRGRGGDKRNDKPEDNRSDRGDRGERRQQPTISDLLREGQEILVQIAKEPIAKKGARITSHIALPGRFLVYMPTIEHLGVSRKIESSSERGRLRTLIQRIRNDETIPSGGFIVRTAGIGISEEDLRQDARYLVRTWLDIKRQTEKSKSPALVHQDLDIVQRLLRDHLSDDFAAIRVDSEEEYLRTVEFINRIQPKMVNRVKFY